MSDKEIKTEYDETISVMEILSIIIKRWRLIVISTVLAGILITIYVDATVRMPWDSSFNKLPSMYKPQVQVRLDTSTSDAMSSIMESSDLGILSSLAGGNSSGPTDQALVQELLIGNTLIDRVVEEADFQSHYDLKGDYRNRARGLFRKGINSEFKNSTGILAISFEDHDPEFATDVINITLDLLEERFKKLTMEKVLVRKSFVEKQFAEIETTFKDAQDTLIEFKKNNNIVDLTSQAALQAEELTSLTSSLINQEQELQNLRAYRDESDPLVRRKKEEIESTKKLIEAKKEGTGEIPDYIPQSRIPELSATQTVLEKELEIQTQLYISLRQQLETVKMEEANNARTFQIVEYAEVPKSPFSPNRGLIKKIVIIIVFFVSVFLAFIIEYFGNVINDPRQKKRIDEMKNAFKFNFRKKGASK